MTIRRIAEIAFLIFVPLLIFLVVSEVFLRIYLTRNIFYDVEMSRYALALKTDEENELIGHHHIQNASAHLMGVTIETNSDGFRDIDYPVGRNEKRRIIILGDSLTLGWGVAREDTFEYVLERKLNEETPTEVINLGIGNYNTTQEVNLFIEKGLKYKPDMVALFYFINDAEPVPQKARFPGLGRLRIITFYWSRIKALKAKYSETVGFYEYYSKLYAPGAEGWKRSERAFKQLKDLSVKEGFDLQVVILPELHNLVDYTFSKEHEQISSFLRANDIAVRDLAPNFKDETDPHSLWVALDDAHPNVRANHLIARYTHDLLSEKKRP